MERNARGTRRFLAVEAALYAAFLTLDLFSARDTRLLKYASIALCLFAAIRIARRGGDRTVALALALTLGADTFLLLLDRWYLLGVLLFFAVQLAYALRLRPLFARSVLLPAALLSAALLALLCALGLLDALTAAAGVYIALFACNIRRSLAWRGRCARLFSAGLALYFLCDLCVGIHNAPALFPPALAAFADWGMWLFYLPGQVLIVLSAEEVPQHAAEK